MNAVRPFVITLAALAAGFGCDRSPTAPQIPAPASAAVASCVAQAPPTDLASCSERVDQSTLRVGRTARPVISAGRREHDDGSPPPEHSNRSSNYAVAW